MVKVLKNIMLVFPFLLFVLLFVSCTENVTPPDSMRLNLHVTVVDTTDFTVRLTGKNQVDDARVFISSVTFYNYFEAWTDTSGLASFEKILPDQYNVSVTKRIIQIIDGVKIERVLNGQLTNIDISGGDSEITVFVGPTSPGTLIFSEIYYNGSPPVPPNRLPQYYHDQFTEIYNNSADTLYLDGKIICDVEYGYIDDDYTHSVHANQFPGTGKDYPILPGEMKIIAQDAIDHTQFVPVSVDLSNADFEYFVDSDVDNPSVTNMVQIHHKYGYDVLYSVMNCAIILLEVKDPYAYGYDNYNCIKFPKSAILDGVDYRDNLQEVEYKRLDPSIDAGLTGGFPMYSHKSIHRQIDYIDNGRIVLMDNNNSTIDFQVLNFPTPGYFFDEAVK
ncbi:MAG: hypothetical protein COT43_00260 [Candidatus Marinimicrobia bacterium CG08_land_8_20_14_0_20_45_22]|nr:MAG: hypothetical protein COT43_00260 [Candidatus Marinimicrobia bacterium CG08_land_8_20_14_0_20_45_22]